MVSISQLEAVFRGKRFVFSDEKDLQAQIEKLLENASLAYCREFRLSPDDIPDFKVDGIVIEVKVKQPKRKIYAQCLRYAAYDQVRAVLLVTGRNMGNPDPLLGKPFSIVNINQAWL